MPDIIDGTMIIYAIKVTTQSLQAACWAYRTLSDQIHFLDLILLRRRRGSLQSTTPTSRIAELPAEVWVRIRFHLFRKDLFSKQQGFVNEQFCEKWERHLDKVRTYDPAWEEVEWVRQSCKACRKHYDSQKVANLFRFDVGEEALTPLLARFGLYAPQKDATPNRVADERNYDMDYEHSVFLIAAPTFDAGWGGKKLFSDDPDDECQIGYHSYEPLPRLASDADDRFRRLVSYCRLVGMEYDPENGSSDKLPPPTGGIRPEWMQWTSAHEEQ